MTHERLNVVTGALGYTGRYIAGRLLDGGGRVRTLTNSADRPNPFGDRLDIRPFSFDDAGRLSESLRGAEVLFNTYWVRFNHTRFKHATAVENSLRLFEAAEKAGVRRIVHTSISNADENSPLEYFNGKGKLERALKESGLSYAILRPTVIFGKEDILINNIAWVLRKFPIFGLFGDGAYRLQPIFVEDFAELAVAEGDETENRVIDAIGPETFTYRELVETIAKIIGKSRPVVALPPLVSYLTGAIIGALVGDVTVTREEIKGLMADLLHTESPAAGKTRLSDWARENAETLGIRYASELARRR